MTTGDWVTEYAEPSASWESWYDAYRFGALYLFPPLPLRSRINDLRARHDPVSQAICDAHVSLTVPFPRPMSHADAAELALLVGSVSAFALVWGPPYQYPGIPGVVLPIGPEEALVRLVNVLESGACFQGAAARPHPFSPHMTIAEFITMEQSTLLVSQLAKQELQGEYWCSEVSYAVPNADFRFTERCSWRMATPRT